MIIRAMRLRVATAHQDFGFTLQFSRHLNIIHAKNSSGKSTMFNSVLYGLGMEELIGGKNEKVLPYAIKEYFEYNGTRVEVVASEILLEIENSKSDIITLRRAIRDSVKDTKLIEIFNVAHLTKNEPLGTPRPTYLHDAGSAKREEGFYRFLENFLGLALPQVPATSGGEVTLYLQTIFAALAVEQKRGWTDYVASIPFFGIRNARTRVVEFLLKLGTFETNTLRHRLNAESIKIDSDWRQTVEELRREARSFGVELLGVSSAPTALFDASEFRLVRKLANEVTPISEYIIRLQQEYQTLEQETEQFSKISSVEVLNKVTIMSEELQHLTVLHERALSSIREKHISLHDYKELLEAATDDLEKNKAARKLRDLGATQDIKTAIGLCPTCNQSLQDTLLADAVIGPQMDFEANIKYLDSQRKMLVRQIAGLQDSIQTAEVKIAEIEARLVAKRDVLVAMRTDVTSGATESRAAVRRQVQIEVEIDALQQLDEKAIKTSRNLVSIAERMKSNQTARSSLPKDAYTEDDYKRIKIFQQHFRKNADSFGYKSAVLTEVEIEKDNLVPSLSQMELREIRTDIKADSSASDFVRLIWSYLLALHQTSNTPNFEGNHLGILMLDEPGQHSMAAYSQHALFKQLASEKQLQSIVAASFDENEDVFRQATTGIIYRLITWDGKLLKPMYDL